MNDSQDRTVVAITNAARGLGLGIARRFASAGSIVVLTDADGEAGRAAVDTLLREGAAASFAELDGREPEQIRAAIHSILADYGHIDVWVNNSDIDRGGPAELLSRSDWEESVAVVLSSSLYCSQAVGREMLARGSGVIINVASLDGYQPIEGRAARSVVQAGLIMLTQALGIEWAKRGVRVVGVAHGSVGDDGTEGKATSGTSIQAQIRRTPARRLVRAEEVAEAVLFMSSDEASYVVAETLRVDGGWTAYQLF